MAKTNKKRYWKNWNEIIVPTDTVSKDFKQNVDKWAQKNKVSIVIRTGSRRVEIPEEHRINRWSTHKYETYWRCWIENEKDATLFSIVCR